MSLRKLTGRLLSQVSGAFVRKVLWRLEPPTYIVLLGGPGAGKGTLAADLAPKLGLSHVSTGTLFRREIASGSALGQSVEPILKSGALVPDEITIAVLAEELSRYANRKGAILDGFPRTEAQALLLDQLLSGWSQNVSVALFLDVNENDLVERLAGRRMCSNQDCGRSFHVVFDPPWKENVCNHCGSALFRRDDDDPAVVLARIAKFNQSNNPILAHYRGRKCLTRLAATNRDGKESVLARAVSLLS